MNLCGIVAGYVVFILLVGSVNTSMNRIERLKKLLGYKFLDKDEKLTGKEYSILYQEAPFNLFGKLYIMLDHLCLYIFMKVYKILL